MSTRELTRLLRCSFTYEFKRFYARGTRFFPPGYSSSVSGENDDKRSEDLPRYRRESAEELLGNAASFNDGTPANKPKTRMEDVWNSSVYPKGSDPRRSQAQHSVRPDRNPADTSVILFPGQGTQFVGMGKKLLQYRNVKDMFELASSILGFDLLTLCIDGPKQELDQTLYCQPAMLVTSLACLEKLKHTNPSAIQSCIGTAGFSVGEITALVFAGSLSFENAVQLVKVRAKAMHLASEMTPSGMMTVFLAPDSELSTACMKAKKHCETLGLERIDCRIANFLYPSCKVIAGNVEALDFIEKHAADFKLNRLKRLPVSGAFHTKLMEPAVEVVSKALSKMQVQDPIIPVHMNIDGKRYRTAKQVRTLLPKQIVRPVCWEQIMHVLYERNPSQEFPATFECGPGSSLKAILKRVNNKAAHNCTSIEA